VNYEGINEACYRRDRDPITGKLTRSYSTKDAETILEMMVHEQPFLMQYLLAAAHKVGYQHCERDISSFLHNGGIVQSVPATTLEPFGSERLEFSMPNKETQ